MPWPRSNRTSHRDEGALSAPRSMKEVGSTHAATGVTSARTPLPSSATRQRWNTFLLIPSRRQNSEAAMPLAAWRENSSRHVASLRRIRLVFFIAPVSSTITGRYYPQWTDLRKYVAELPVTDLGIGEGAIVAQERIHAVGFAVVGDGGLIDREA